MGHVKRCLNKYCALITLDVKNAFNSASWRIIIKLIAQRLLPTQSNHISECGEIHEAHDGCTTRSALSLILWKIMDEMVLRIPLAANTQIIAYTEALLLTAKLEESLKQKVNETLYLSPIDDID